MNDTKDKSAETEGESTKIENAENVTIESGDKDDDKASAKDDTAGDVAGSAEA